MITLATNSLASDGGGTAYVVQRLAETLSNTAQNVTTVSISPRSDPSGSIHTVNNLINAQFPPTGPRSLGWSWPLHRYVLSSTSHSAKSIIHQHGLWSLLSYTTSQSARNTGHPLLISPHGMLEPNALKISKLKKVLFSAMIEKRHLQRAACLHALTEAEAQHCRDFGLTNPIAVVPNGIDLPPTQPPLEQPLHQRHPELIGKKILLSMSRLHPKKGLPMLLDAWQALHAIHTDWILVIAGPDENQHQAALETQARSLGVEHKVLFPGPISLTEKWSVLSEVTAFVLPSHSEGFPISILEAAACRLPVLFTTSCYFPELAKAGGGIEVPATSKTLADGLDKMLAFSPETRRSMGKAGQHLVESTYTWPRISDDMLSVYNWLSSEASPPKCVRFHDK